MTVAEDLRHAPPGASGAKAPTPAEEQARQTTSLLRFVGALGAWAFLSIAAGMAFWDFEDHKGHIALAGFFGAVCVLALAFAPTLARRMHGA